MKSLTHIQLGEFNARRALKDDGRRGGSELEDAGELLVHMADETGNALRAQLPRKRLWSERRQQVLVQAGRIVERISVGEAKNLGRECRGVFDIGFSKRPDGQTHL